MAIAKSRDRRVRRTRNAVELTPEIERRLHSYAAATEAAHLCKATLSASVVTLAGFAVLTSIPLEAEIAYTPANQVLDRHWHIGSSRLSLDLNHDGQVDFDIRLWFGTSFSSSNASIFGGVIASGNGMSNRVVHSSKSEWEAALPRAAPIGPAGKFGPAQAGMASCDFNRSSTFSAGPWKNVTNRYLGLRFLIDGEMHYGWARLNVTYGCGYRVTLTGYAYETVPNKTIYAGILPFANESSLSPAHGLPSRAKPASLGALALGAAGLQIWRGE